MTTVVYEDGLPILRCDWTWEDIKCVDKTLTDEQIVQVMNLIARTHDATIGINWDVIEIAIDHIKEKS